MQNIQVYKWTKFNLQNVGGICWRKVFIKNFQQRVIYKRTMLIRKRLGIGNLERGPFISQRRTRKPVNGRRLSKRSTCLV